MIGTTQRLLGAILVAFATDVTLARADPGVVVFGDSSSDTGNGFAATGELILPLYSDLDAFRISRYPYAAGAGRFTNGRTWVE